MTNTANAALTIRFPRKGLVHIDGIAPATLGGGNDMGDYISYAAETSCAALTRGRITFAFLTETVELRHADDASIPVGRVRRTTVAKTFSSGADALAAARKLAARNGGSVCGNCEAAASR